jgi:hypothetical protein
MPSIANGQRFTNTSSTQLLIGGVVLLFVVGLFFVPQVVPPRETTAENAAYEQALSTSNEDFSFEELLGTESADEGTQAVAREDIRARHAGLPDADSPAVEGAFDRFDIASLLGGETPQQEFAEIAPAGPVDESPEEDERILVAENTADDSALGKVSRLLEDLSTPEHRRVSAETLVADDMSDGQAVGLETVAMQQRREQVNQKGATESNASEEATKEKDVSLFPEGEGVTWKLIHRGKSKRKIRKAGKNAQKIAIGLGHKYQNTRFAITNYVGGLNRVMIGKGIKAHEVPQFLAELEKEVTTAMAQEGVPQADILQWADISLGPELQTVVERQRKEQMVRPFDPKIRLSKLKVRQGYKHRGKWDPTARVAVKLSGYISGKHVKKIELYRNGKRVKKLPLEKRSDDEGNRVFRMRQGQHVRDAVYTFKVTDSKDRVFEKSYLFYPKVRAFKWNGKTDGSFAIPFKEDDPRLDSYFRNGGKHNNGFGAPRKQVAFARF